MVRKELVEARILAGLSQEDVAEKVGVTRNTVSQWERGLTTPYPIHVQHLCKLFGKTAQELGLATNLRASIQRKPQRISNTDAAAISSDVLAITVLQGRPVADQGYRDTSDAWPLLALPATTIRPVELLESAVPDYAMRFGLLQAQTIALIEQWYGMALFCHDLQAQLDRSIKELDGLKLLYSPETYILSRRSFLVTLAALPAAWLISSKQAHKLLLNLEEFLPQCAASITACWHLSGGSELDSIVPIIDSYLPTLIALMKHAPTYCTVIADLIAQCYFLKTMLAWHLEGLDTAETYCTQAMQYSKFAENSNLQLTALNLHALIAYYSKQFAKALAKSEEANELLQCSSHEHIFPIVQGRVYMYLAAIQAQQDKGKAEKTLSLAQNAFALQVTSAEPIPLYADCGEASLTLWDGLTYYHLSLHNPSYAKQALVSLGTFGELEPTTKIPERFRLECLNNRTLAAIQSNEIEEAILCLKAGIQGARTLGSKRRIAEVCYAYQLMLRRWPKERQLQTLKEPYENMLLSIDTEE